MSDKMMSAIKCGVFAAAGYFVGGPIGALIGLIIAIYQDND